MNHPPDPHNSQYKTIKTSLSSVAADYDVVFGLNDAVLVAHRIAIHTLQFLKMYMIYSFDTTHQLPILDHSLILNVMKVLAPKKTNGGCRPKDTTIELKSKLEAFYLQHYHPLIATESPLSSSRLNTILEYMATTVETVYHNNIKQHFVSTVERYVNVFYDKSCKVEEIKTNNALTLIEKRAQLTKLSTLLRCIKTDILSLSPILLSPAEYHPFILQARMAILPQKISYQQNSVYYDLRSNPLDYLSGMFRILRYIESRGYSIINLFPLRSSIIPKYIKIDTVTLVELLINSKKHGHTKTYYRSKGNIVRLENTIWSLFFKTQKKCFYNKEYHKYRFNSMIETDGIGCSIQLIRQDLFGRTHLRQSKNLTGVEKYIDEASIDILRNKKLVAIDPNLSDLLYCVTKEDDRVSKLRYTQNQRRKETKSKDYQRSLEEFKGSTVIEGQTVTQWETQFSQEMDQNQCNHKTLNFENFQKYIRRKSTLNSKLLGFYEIFEHRRLRWYGYINRQRSESQFLNRFKAIFGSPDQVVIGIGDYEQSQHRKFKEPVKGKSFRKMFRRAGYKDVYLVDEHKTSCKCHNCKDVVKDNQIVGGECTTFRKCQNPRPWRKEESIIRHGLLMCQTCRKLWCRDTNAALNIWEIMNSAKNEVDRPQYLMRGKVSISNTTSVLH
jgi:hypothetical protein